MRAVFVHDHYFSESEGQFYTGGSFPAVIWGRYLKAFDALTVIGRRGEHTPGRSLASAEGVSFTLAPSISGRAALANRKAARAVLHEALSNADALIARIPSELGFEAVSVARALGKPYAIELVGCPWDGYRHFGTAAGLIYAPFAFLRARRALWRAPFAIYVTRRFLQSRYPTQGRQAGVSDVVVRSLGKAPTEHDGPFTLGTVGSLYTRQKGVHTAIEALRLLGRKDVRYRVLGGGDRGRFEGSGVDVEFCGALPPGDPVFEWVDSLDLYLQPSFQEGLPRALVEAMSRGRPAIGSTAGGIPELLPAEALHKPGDARALAALIDKALSDRALRRRWAEHSLEVASSYLAESLDAERDAFWRDFRRHVDAKAA